MVIPEAEVPMLDYLKLFLSLLICVEERSYSTFKVRRGGSEEIPLVQGKEQQVCFAGAAVMRYPTPKVRETHVRW